LLILTFPLFRLILFVFVEVCKTPTESGYKWKPVEILQFYRKLCCRLKFLTFTQKLSFLISYNALLAEWIWLVQSVKSCTNERLFFLPRDLKDRTIRNHAFNKIQINTSYLYFYTNNPISHSKIFASPPINSKCTLQPDWIALSNSTIIIKNKVSIQFEIPLSQQIQNLTKFLTHSRRQIPSSNTSRIPPKAVLRLGQMPGLNTVTHPFWVNIWLFAGNRKSSNFLFWNFKD
jgi:hypothetical protein